MLTQYPACMLNHRTVVSVQCVVSKILVQNVTVDGLYSLSRFLYCELNLFVKLLVKSSFNH
jgi:hypothetical protein